MTSTSRFSRLEVDKLVFTQNQPIVMGDSKFVFPNENSTLATVETQQTLFNKTIIGDGDTQYVSANALTCGDVAIPLSTSHNSPSPGQVLTINNSLHAGWSCPPPHTDLFKISTKIPSGVAAKIHLFTLSKYVKVCLCSTTLLIVSSTRSNVIGLKGAFQMVNSELIPIGRTIFEKFDNSEVKISLISEGLELHLLFECDEEVALTMTSTLLCDDV